MLALAPLRQKQRSRGGLIDVDTTANISSYVNANIIQI